MRACDFDIAQDMAHVRASWRIGQSRSIISQPIVGFVNVRQCDRKRLEEGHQQRSSLAFVDAPNLACAIRSTDTATPAGKRTHLAHLCSRQTRRCAASPHVIAHPTHLVGGFGIPVGIGDAALVMSHQPAAVPRDIACGIGMGDAAHHVVSSHQPAAVPRDIACGIGMGDAAHHVVSSHQPAAVPRDIACGIGIGDAAIVISHQPADSTSATTDTPRGINIAEGRPGFSAADQCGGVLIARNTPPHQPEVTQGAAAFNLAKQRDFGRRRPVDGQPVDRMPQAIQRAGEGIAIPRAFAHRLKPRSAIPPRCRAGVDRAAQYIISGEISQHSLQIRAGCGARRPQARQNGVARRCPGSALFRAEAACAGQVDRGADVICCGVPADIPVAAPLPIFQHQPRCARAIHRRIDVDVAICIQSQRIAAPAYGVVDMDVAICPTRTAAGENVDIPATQVGRQCCPGEIPARGCDGEIDGVDEPGAVLAAG